MAISGAASLASATGGFASCFFASSEPASRTCASATCASCPASLEPSVLGEDELLQPTEAARAKKRSLTGAGRKLDIPRAYPTRPLRAAPTTTERELGEPL
jgi:hypothetical protein